MLRKFFLVIVLLSAIASPAQEQKDTSLYIFRNAEAELADLLAKAFRSKNEKERIEGNRELIAVWDRIVADPRILRYSFEKLKTDISILSPRDNKFKLITWNLHRDDGTHAYFGFLLVNNSKRVKKGFLRYETEQTYEYFKLSDKSSTVKYPESHVGTPDKWFGMLYTQLVECGDYYTLIGWDGNNKLTQRKFVDVLYFRSNGTPVFGKDVFKFPRKNPKRMMFEWSQEVSMSVKYVEKRDLILISNLSPNQRNGVLEGQYQYYGPDGDFNALVFKKDKWVWTDLVESNSDIEPLKESKKPNPRKQTPLYKPK